MANSMNKDLIGRNVILLDGMKVKVVEGFGAFSFTSGTALCCEYNGVPCRFNGYDINTEATESLWKQESAEKQSNI